MILDSYVTLPTMNYGVALVTSKEWPHRKYWVHSLESKWASYDCPYAQHWNICKHQVKMLQLLHLELVEGTITHYYGALEGIVHGGFQNLWSPTIVGNSPSIAQYTPPTSRTPKASPKVDLEDEVCLLQLELVKEARDNKLLLEHLFASLQIISGKQKKLWVEIQNGMLHPFHKVSTFKCNLDNNAWSLKCHKDLKKKDY
jgi:hypothetical protein